MSEEFHEGDLVEAVKGESVVRGRLKRGTFEYNKDFTYVGDSADYRTYLKDGWTLTVIEKAAPKLPTEPGWYLTRDEDQTVYLAPDGSWMSTIEYGVPPKIIAKMGPLTRLEPVPVTAKKVLDAIRGRIGSIDSAHDFQAVAATFGVSE